MKIAFLNEKYVHHSTGGAQESVRILAETLVGRGHEVGVWTTTHQADQGESVEVHGGVRVVHLPIANLYWPHGHRPAYLKPFWHALDAFNPGMATRVGRLLDTEKPAVLHTNILASFSPSVWGEARRRGIPVVHTMRDHYLRCPSGEMFTAEGNCERQCLVCSAYSAPKKLATHHVDAVVGISDFLLQEHLAAGYFPSTPVRQVIHNSYAPEGEPVTRKRMGEGLRIGYLGRLFETKGIEMLIDAVTQELDGSARLLLAGAGEPGYEQALRDRCVHAPGKIAFLGVVPPRELFEQIDVLAVPSLWREPFGRIVIEANAWGIPVVASRRGGLPEIVDDGVTGYLFDPGHQGELARVLRRLTPEHCAGMREACVDKAQAFLPETIAAQYEALYRRVIASACEPAALTHAVP